MARPHAPRTRVSTYVSDWISRVNTVDYLVVAGGGGGQDAVPYTHRTLPTNIEV